MKTMHMCQSVRGALSNYNTDRKLERAFKNCIKTDSGKVLQTAHEIREFFFDQLAQGREVLPLGECDNFDYKKGCLGHEK